MEWRGTGTHAVLRNQSGSQVAQTSAVGAGYPTMMNNVQPGWYDLELVDGSLVVDSIKVGVGDVYVAFGQSNSVSQRQPSNFIPVTPDPGRVILSKYYPDGAGMHTFFDPGVETLTGAWAGVGWLYCGLALNRPYPVMFVIIGKGNQTYEQWANLTLGPGVPDPRLITAFALYQPKAFLWQQGESECPQGGPPNPSSNAMMDGIIQSLRSVTATPVVIAINSTSYPPPSGYSEWPVRVAQRAMVTKWPHCRTGPDTDAIREGGVNGVEFLGVRLQQFGVLWSDNLKALGL